MSLLGGFSLVHSLAVYPSLIDPNVFQLFLCYVERVFLKNHEICELSLLNRTLDLLLEFGVCGVVGVNADTFSSGSRRPPE